MTKIYCTTILTVNEYSTINKGIVKLVLWYYEYFLDMEAKKPILLEIFQVV